MTLSIWRTIHDWRTRTLPTDIRHMRIAEIGSRVTDGQEACRIRSIFGGAEYKGIDLAPGDGVDVVADMTKPDNWPLLDTADVALCLETIEHVPEFWRILEGINRRLLPGAWVILSAPGITFPIHKHPVDCYRFTEFGLHAALRATGARISFSHTALDTLGHPSHVAGGQYQ